MSEGTEALFSAAEREAYDKGFDDGQDEIWGESVCSVCGANHDRDESSMCLGGEVVTFSEWLSRTQEWLRSRL